MFTQLDLDNIDRAIASGKKRAQINLRMVEFQSGSDLIMYRRLIIRDLEEQAAKLLGKKKVTAVKVVTCKGWNK